MVLTPIIMIKQEKKLSYHFRDKSIDNFEFMKSNSDDDYNEPITRTEIHMAVNEIKVKKAMVYDSINCEIVKLLYISNPGLLSNVFNKIWDTEFYSDSW